MARAKERCEKDPKDGVAAAKELLFHGKKALGLVELFFGKGSGQSSELSEDIAKLCNQLPVAYHNATGDDDTCIEVLKATLPLACSSELQEQIRKNIETLSGNIKEKRLKPFYEALKKVQDSKESAETRFGRMRSEVYPLIQGCCGEGKINGKPKDEAFNAFAIVLRGISLDAWNNEHDKDTAISANDWALKWALDGELLAQLNKDRQTLKSLNAAPAISRQPAANTSGSGTGCGGVIGVFVLIGLFSAGVRSCNEGGSSSPTRTYTPPTTTYSQPSSYGNTYRVNSSVSSELRTEKAAIESERAELETLSRALDTAKAQLDWADRTLNRYSQYEIDAYNQKVGAYNAQLQDYRTRQAAFNGRVDAYNAKLRAKAR
jgi:hypothetical protein